MTAAVSTAATVESTAATVESATTAAVESATTTAVESATTAMEAIATVKPAAITATMESAAVSAPVAVAAMTVVSAVTVISAAIVATAAVESAAIVTAVVPGAGADEDAVDKVIRSVVAVGRAGVRIVVVVTVNAGWCGADGTVDGAYPDAHGNLSMGAGRDEKQNSQQCNIF